MRNAPRIGSLMGAIYASRQNCWPGGISNGDGISHTASGPRLRYVRDAVSSFLPDETLDLIDGARVPHERIPLPDRIRAALAQRRDERADRAWIAGPRPPKGSENP